MFLQEVNEEAERKEKGRNNGWKESNEKAAMLRPALAGVAYRRLCVTLLGVYWGINRLIPWPVLQCVLAGHVWHSRHPPSTLSPATHTHTISHNTLSNTHSALTAVPLRQHRVLFLPSQNPGCPSRQESKASLNPERVNEAEERKREQHRPSPTSLLPVLLFAR